jgi:UTP:GlnB (protein PII) uridylyltransferase
MTIGERAEDVFYISDESGNPLEEEAKSRLRDALIRAIDEDSAASQDLGERTPV